MEEGGELISLSNTALMSIFAKNRVKRYITLSLHKIRDGIVMLRSTIFSKATAYVGIVTGVLMSVPSTAATIGPYFALLSLLPFAVWCILIARRLFGLGQGTS